jgi:hypothetical protein
VAAQIGSFTSLLKTEYSNIVKFITTPPSWFVQLQADAGLINRQLNAVSLPALTGILC